MNEQPRFWKPTSTLGRWLCGLLVVQAVLSVLLALVNEAKGWVEVNAALDTLNSTNSNAVNDRVSRAFQDAGAPWLQLVGYATTAVLVFFVIWTYRSAVNAQALRRIGARQSPGWTIAGWLVPILNWVLPYQAVSDLWRSSAPDAAPGSEWRASGPSARVASWWFAYLVGTVAYGVSIAFVFTGDFTASDARPWMAGSHVVQAVAALLGAWVVWDITLRQARQQEADPAPTRDQAYARGVYPAQTITRGPDGLPVPGWYPDPNGAFDHRYWDGRAWTEHVSTAGVATLAPVVAAPALVASTATTAAPEVAPDWYPDPSGRHQWRFWGGSDWTPHVSDDGAHSDDPLDGPAPAPTPLDD
jgi:hypothetical protein